MSMQESSGVALWRQVADGIERGIADGRFAAGEKLPGEMEIAETYRVNRHTVRRALAAWMETRGIEAHLVADGPAAFAEVLTSGDAMAENSLDEPLKVSPKPFAITAKDGVLRHDFPANSFSVIRLKLRR